MGNLRARGELSRSVGTRDPAGTEPDPVKNDGSLVNDSQGRAHRHRHRFPAHGQPTAPDSRQRHRRPHRRHTRVRGRL